MPHLNIRLLVCHPKRTAVKVVTPCSVSLSGQINVITLLAGLCLWIGAGGLVVAYCIYIPLLQLIPFDAGTNVDELKA
jgi:hypothetical protein